MEQVLATIFMILYLRNFAVNYLDVLDVQGQLCLFRLLDLLLDFPLPDARRCHTVRLPLGGCVLE